MKKDIIDAIDILCHRIDNAYIAGNITLTSYEDIMDKLQVIEYKINKYYVSL